MTRQQFWDRFPEFSTTSPALVDAALAEAARGMSPTVYGARFDDAQAQRAGHILHVSPFGETTRLDGDKDPETKSRYWDRFVEIRREVAPRSMVL